VQCKSKLMCGGLKMQNNDKKPDNTNNSVDNHVNLREVNNLADLREVDNLAYLREVNNLADLDKLPTEDALANEEAAQDMRGKHNTGNKKKPSKNAASTNGNTSIESEKYKIPEIPTLTKTYERLERIHGKDKLEQKIAERPVSKHSMSDILATRKTAKPSDDFDFNAHTNDNIALKSGKSIGSNENKITTKLDKGIDNRAGVATPERKAPSSKANKDTDSRIISTQGANMATAPAAAKHPTSGISAARKTARPSEDFDFNARINDETVLKTGKTVNPDEHTISTMLDKSIDNRAGIQSNENKDAKSASIYSRNKYINAEDKNKLTADRYKSGKSVSVRSSDGKSLTSLLNRYTSSRNKDDKEKLGRNATFYSADNKVRTSISNRNTKNKNKLQENEVKLDHEISIQTHGNEIKSVRSDNMDSKIHSGDSISQNANNAIRTGKLQTYESIVKTGKNAYSIGAFNFNVIKSAGVKGNINASPKNKYIKLTQEQLRQKYAKEQINRKYAREQLNKKLYDFAKDKQYKVNQANKGSVGRYTEDKATQENKGSVGGRAGDSDQYIVKRGVLGNNTQTKIIIPDNIIKTQTHKMAYVIRKKPKLIREKGINTASKTIGGVAKIVSTSVAYVGKGFDNKENKDISEDLKEKAKNKINSAVEKNIIYSLHKNTQQTATPRYNQYEAQKRLQTGKELQAAKTSSFIKNENLRRAFFFRRPAMAGINVSVGKNLAGSLIKKGLEFILHAFLKIFTSKVVLICLATFVIATMFLIIATGVVIAPVAVMVGVAGFIDELLPDWLITAAEAIIEWLQSML